MHESHCHSETVMPEFTSDELDELEASFDHFDTDNNGRIDLHEFLALMAALDEDMSTAEARLGFSEVDGDHDGSIDLDEFIQWWTGR